jgi:outer membrane protein OmpA-like peptidoglycan-associated protein
MDYLKMRKAITAISFTMLGASGLIFLFALLIPLQREFFSQEKEKTEFRELSGVNNENAIAKSVPEQRLSSGVNSNLESSSKPVEGKVGQNDHSIEKKRENSSAMQSLHASSSEPTLPQVHEKPPELALPEIAEEKAPPPHGPMRLLVLGEGSFSPGVAKPEAKAQAAIDNIIPLIQARSSDKVVIEGHADKSIPGGFTPIQASKWNKIISMLRAKAVAQVLKQKGVAGDRIIVKGLGDAVPLASNHSRAGRSKNRRVEIKLLPARH